MDFSRYDVVSFDVFDTLVARCVARPSDVFLLVEARAVAVGLTASGFAASRVEAERAARSSAAGREIALDEIYRELEIAGLSPRLCRDLREIEIQVEFDVCTQREDGARLFSEALASGVRVVIASDMYLPIGVIEGMLAECGYAGWERVFLSCDCGARKADGSMFGLMSKELGVAPSRMLHVGDNARSDVMRARLAGLHALHLPMPAAQKDADRGLAASVLEGIRATYAATDDRLFDLGYCALGSVLVGVAEWLCDKCRTLGVEKVFFLARDGLVLQRSVELLGRPFPPSTYLYVSRRALLVPSLCLKGTFADVIDSMFLGRTVSLSVLFGKMGLDCNLVRDELNRLGIDAEVERESRGIAEDREARRAYDALKSAILDNSQRQFFLLERYLKDEGFSGRVAIVDIGWFGNMQLSLESVCQVCGAKADIVGLYVGLCPDGKNQFAKPMSGYLFSATENRRLYVAERNFNSIFEVMFSATHGTTLRYEEKGKFVVPVLDAYEGAEAETGVLAERIREGALAFVIDWGKIHTCGGISASLAPQDAFAELARVGSEPTREEAELFGEWVIEDNGERCGIARPKRLGYYLFHPKTLLRDFDAARWKVGFMRRLFKLPLPYSKAWNFVHGLYARGGLRDRLLNLRRLNL